MIIHVLRYGFALCGFSVALPRDWPEYHRWVPLENWEQATCQWCRQAAQPQWEKLRQG